jgi:hypothetical protein
VTGLQARQLGNGIKFPAESSTRGENLVFFSVQTSYGNIWLNHAFSVLFAVFTENT